jgi:hypothetical protein
MLASCSSVKGCLHRGGEPFEVDVGNKGTATGVGGVLGDGARVVSVDCMAVLSAWLGLRRWCLQAWGGGCLGWLALGMAWAPEEPIEGFEHSVCAAVLGAKLIEL